MLQIMRALERRPGQFTVERVHMKRDEFLGQAGNLYPGASIAWDETTTTRRKAMHGHNVQFLDFLTTCRGLGLNIGLCYPHEDLIDRAILDHRVLYNIHILERTRTDVRARVRVRTSYQYRNETRFKWEDIQDFRFRELVGPLRDAYDAKKKDHMENLGSSYLEDVGHDIGLDFEAGADVLTQLKGLVRA